MVTGKNSEDAAKALRDLPEEWHLQEKISCRSLFLPSGTKTVKFVTYEDSLQLVMALGGKQANQMKTQFAKILTRLFAGDATVAEEQEEPEVISHLQLQEVSFDEFKIDLDRSLNWMQQLYFIKNQQYVLYTPYILRHVEVSGILRRDRVLKLFAVVFKVSGILRRDGVLKLFAVVFKVSGILRKGGVLKIFAVVGPRYKM